MYLLIQYAIMINKQLLFFILLLWECAHKLQVGIITLVRMPASVQKLNESKDVIKYWKHDMSCMKMICDYKVHREPLSTVGKFLYIFYMNWKWKADRFPPKLFFFATI